MKQKLSKRLANFIIRAIASTWKIRVIGDLPEKHSVVAFWHNKMLPVWKLFSKYQPASAVVSKSKDGQYIADLLSAWGYFKVLRGSSSSDKQALLREMCYAAKETILLITPDGPRGEIYKLKAGAAVVAARMQVPFYFLKVKIDRKKVFENSWDKFEFPLPFASVTIEISKPYHLLLDTREYIDDFINKIEIEMNDEVANL